METVPDGKRFSNAYNLKKSLAFAFAFSFAYVTL